MRRFWKRHPEIVRVECVEIGPNDVVILETDMDLTPEQVDRLGDAWKRAVGNPGQRAVVACKFRVKVLREVPRWDPSVCTCRAGDGRCVNGVCEDQTT